MTSPARIGGRTVTTVVGGVTTADPWVLWLAMVDQMAHSHPVLTERHFRNFERVTAARWDGDTLVLVADRATVAYLTEHFARYLHSVASAETGESIQVRFEGGRA